MGYFLERRGTRIEDKWMFMFLLTVSAALVIALGLVVYFRKLTRELCGQEFGILANLTNISVPNIKDNYLPYHQGVKVYFP